MAVVVTPGASQMDERQSLMMIAAITPPPRRPMQLLSSQRLS
jgi:hypothetical protein